MRPLKRRLNSRETTSRIGPIQSWTGVTAIVVISRHFDPVAMTAATNAIGWLLAVMEAPNVVTAPTRRVSTHMAAHIAAAALLSLK